jgi:hypothetical protein
MTVPISFERSLIFSFVTSLPSISTLPENSPELTNGITPFIIESRVLFPSPETPDKSTVSPYSTVRFIFSSTFSLAPSYLKETSFSLIAMPIS